METQNIVQEIKQYHKKWLKLVQRMDTNRIPKQALKYKPKARRNIGRPRKRWRDQLCLEDQGTENTTKSSGTSRYICIYIYIYIYIYILDSKTYTCCAIYIHLVILRYNFWYVSVLVEMLLRM